MIADLSQGRTPRQISGKDGASACATLVERTTRYLITRGPASGAQGRPGLLRAHTPHPRPTRGCDANTDMGPRPRNGPPPAPHPRHWRGSVSLTPTAPGRGTNDNTNRLIRRYLPKGTPITSHQPYLDAIAYEPGNCPRATLGYRTPTQAFNQLIATTH